MPGFDFGGAAAGAGVGAGAGVAVRLPEGLEPTPGVEDNIAAATAAARLAIGAGATTDVHPRVGVKDPDPEGGVVVGEGAA